MGEIHFFDLHHLTRHNFGTLKVPSTISLTSLARPVYTPHAAFWAHCPIKKETVLFFQHAMQRSDSPMPKLFEPSIMAGLTLRTRSVRSATWEGLADSEGFVRPELIKMMTELARGQIGLIVAGYVYVSPEGRGLPWQTGICRDAHMAGLKEMTAAVHAENGLVAAQLAHAGARTRSKTIAATPCGPSALKGFAFGDTPRQMDLKDIQRVIDDFAEAARRARQAGFDAVQLHAAHGYLISQFLSPLTNHRTDAYGGTAENRRRFLLQVASAVRAAVGEKFPILLKINSEDWPPGGVDALEAAEAVQALAETGIAGVEISGGLAGSEEARPSRKNITAPSAEAYFRSAARIFRQHLQIPIILVGGVRSCEVAEDLIASADADFISLSRPLICEPDLILRWKQGRQAPAACISCNLCLKEGLSGNGIACKLGKEK
jgi:2,4-dienoyl-CoA reductase-like NADH-dependent reductase (Old Yellow Enzyme family)